jgi:hypothetical protein
MQQFKQQRLARRRNPQRSLEDSVRLAALAHNLIRHELWIELAADLEAYKKGVINELLRHSDSLSLDNEKRAMVFAFDRVLEFPHRLIENGERARHALEQGEKNALNRQHENRAQAVETLGFDQAID